MAWRIAIGAGVAVVLVAAAAAFALMPRSSGDGWRLDPPAAWEEQPPLDGLGPTAIVYGSDATSVGIGVTAFGSSSCPPELRGVEIGEDEIRVAIGEPFPFGGCTADAAPHQFGIVVDRERLPDPPFDVVVDHDGRAQTTRIDALP